MADVFRSALDIVMEWGIPASLVSFGAWLAIKRDAMRERWRRRQARRCAIDSFIEQQMPELVSFVAGSKEREDKALARETRITTELRGFSEHLSRQDGHLSRQDGKLDNIEAQLWAAARFDIQARFQCDSEGRNVAVNSVFAKMLHVSEFELGDLRWKSLIDEDDAKRYNENLQRCLREYRRFEGNVIFRRPDGTRVRTSVRVEPYPEDPADLAEGRSPTWFGFVGKLEELG